MSTVEVDRAFEHFWPVGYKPPIAYHPDDPLRNYLMVPIETEYHDVNPGQIFLVGLNLVILGVACVVIRFRKHMR